MKYQWKIGSRIKVPAQKAGERIDGLREKLGRGLTADDVLTDAEYSSSPLHDAFEWSDSKAAREFRLQQARHLLNCLIVVRIKVQHPEENTPRTVTNVRAWHPVIQGGERGYETTGRIMSSAELRQQLLDDALDELNSFKTRYRKLRELASVFQAISEFRKRVRKKPVSVVRRDQSKLRA